MSKIGSNKQVQTSRLECDEHFHNLTGKTYPTCDKKMPKLKPGILYAHLQHTYIDKTIHFYSKIRNIFEDNYGPDLAMLDLNISKLSKFKKTLLKVIHIDNMCRTPLIKILSLIPRHIVMPILPFEGQKVILDMRTKAKDIIKNFHPIIKRLASNSTISLRISNDDQYLYVLKDERYWFLIQSKSEKIYLCRNDNLEHYEDYSNKVDNLPLGEHKTSIARLHRGNPNFIQDFVNSDVMYEILKSVGMGHQAKLIDGAIMFAAYVLHENRLTIRN